MEPAAGINAGPTRIHCLYAGEERQYCCRNCAGAAQSAPKNFRRIQNTEPESWTEHIKQAAREAELDRDSRRIRLCTAVSAAGGTMEP